MLCFCCFFILPYDQRVLILFIFKKSYNQMQASKVLVVTGANKGLGYGIIEGVMKLGLQYQIVLCSRDQSNGEKAIASLIQKYPSYKNLIEVGILDISNSQSIQNFRNWFQSNPKNYKQIDVLFNNAGMAFRGNRYDYEVVTTTFKTNYEGTVEFTEAMLNFIPNNGKILFMGSGSGVSTYGRCTSNLQDRFRNIQSFEDLEQMKNELYQSNTDDTYKQKGWPASGYAGSKLF